MRTLPSLSCPSHVVLAQKLAIHVYTRQVHLIALDWDYKLCICLVCSTALFIHAVFLDQATFSEDQEAELSKDKD